MQVDQRQSSVSHRLGHVLLAFSRASKVQTLRVVVLPRGVHSLEDFTRSIRPIRELSELSEYEQTVFPLRQNKFVGTIYDERRLCCTNYYTCQTELESRQKVVWSFDWTAAWCIEEVDLCELCSATVE